MQGARTALNGQRGNQTMTLAIGFGANAAGARAAATGSLASGFTAADRLQGRLGAVPRHAQRRARERRDHAAAASLRAVAARAGRLGGQDVPRRVDRGAEHGMDLGHAHAGARSPLRPVSPRLAARPLPRGHGAEGWPETTRRPTGCSTTCGRCRRPTAPGGRTRASTAPEVDDGADGPGVAPDRARLVAGTHGRDGLGARREGRRLHRRQRTATATTSAGRTRAASRRTRSPPRSPA